MKTGQREAIDTPQQMLVIEANSPQQLLGSESSGRTVRELPSSPRPTICAWWSPDSSKVLCLELASAASATAVSAGDQLRCCWSVVEVLPLAESDEPSIPPLSFRRRSFNPFFPSAHFLERHVPFFDQYHCSVTPWSPDSTSFVYAEAGGAVRVQPLDSPLEVGPLGISVTPDAKLLSGGSMGNGFKGGEVAFWSPC